MEEFIVLGLVPGTSIQIDFYMWLRVATLFAGILTVLIIHRRFSKRTYALSSPALETQEHKVFVSEPTR